MSTKAKLNKLLKTKEDIKKAIQNKGGNVGDVFDEYPAAIKGLESGNINVADNKIKFAYSTFTEIPKKFDFSTVEDASYMFYSGDLKGSVKIDFAPNNLLQAFYNCKKLTDVDFDWTNVDNFSYAFANTAISDLKIGKCQPTNISYMLYDTCVPEVDLTNMDLSKMTGSNYVSSLGNAFTLKSDLYVNKYGIGYTPLNRAYCLRNLDGNITCEGWLTSTIDFYDNYLLSDESVQKLFNVFPEITTNRTVRFNQHTINNLSDETIEIAINKGYTVTPAKTITEPIIVTATTSFPSDLHLITPKTYDFSQYTGSFDDISSLDKYNLHCKYVECEISSPDASHLFETNIRARNSPQWYKIKINSTVNNLEFAFYNANNTIKHPVFVTFTEDSDFSNVTNFNQMFGGGLLSYGQKPIIDVSNWNVSNAENLFGFNLGGGWNTIGVEKWNITNKCKLLPTLHSDLENIDLNHWDVSSATSADYLFEGCKNLKSFNIDQWDISNIRTFDHLFYNCTSLEEVDLSDREFKLNGYRTSDSSGVSYDGGWFEGCTNLKKIKLPKVEAAPWGNGKGNFTLYYLFANCSSLESVDLSPINFDKFTDLGYMFSGCTSLKEVKITSKLANNATVINMFKDVTTDGTLYYNPEYDYSKIIAVLPPTWKAVPITE